MFCEEAAAGEASWLSFFKVDKKREGKKEREGVY